jgi:hypothetical protein
MSMMMIPPFMHGAAQWAAFNAVTMGGRLVIPDDVERMNPGAVLRLAERERVLSIPVVGDAIARPLLDEIETGDYDLSGLVTITNGGAPLSPTVRERILTALPHLMLLDAVGASESGAQMSTFSTAGAETQAATFNPQSDTAVVSADLDRVLSPGEGHGWLARRDLIPLGYLGDEAKTARTFPTINGVRWSVPGDRANVLDDGRIQLLARDSVTINSGGEKIFVEEVERAVAAHPGVYDMVVVGRPSERWGSEVVAIVQLAEGGSATDEELVEVSEVHRALQDPQGVHPHAEGGAVPRREVRLPLGEGTRSRRRQVRVAGKERRVPVAERLHRADLLCRAQRGQRLGLERAGCATEDVLDRFDARFQAGRPRVTPERHLGEPSLQRAQHVVPGLRVGGRDGGRDGERARPPRGRRIVVGLLVGGIHPENLQRADIAPVSEDDGDVPAGQRAVEQPATGGPHDVVDVARPDLEPILAVAVPGHPRPAGTRDAYRATVVGLKRLSVHDIPPLSVLVRIFVPVSTYS